MTAEEKILPITALKDVCAAHELHYYSWGEVTNPRKLLCLHGLTRNAHDFDYLAAALANHYHIIVPDMPGRGNSPKLHNPLQYTYATYMHDIFSLINTVKSATIDIVGTSMGGILAMMIATIKPEIIGKLVINDIGAIITKEGLADIMSYVGHGGPFNTYKQAKDMLRERMQSFGISSEEHWQHLYKHNIIQADNRRYWLAYDPELITPLRQETDGFTQLEDISLWEYWNAIKSPVLLLRGADSVIFTADTAEEMLKSHPGNCELITYEGVGHAPALMDEKQIEDVKKWLLAS